MTALSILDLVRVTQDTDARGALDNARDLAVHAETWGYQQARPAQRARDRIDCGFEKCAHVRHLR
jgi:hypothetical protein